MRELGRNSAKGNKDERSNSEKGHRFLADAQNDKKGVILNEASKREQRLLADYAERERRKEPNGS